MQKHSLGEWFAVTRFWSFAVSLSPVVVTFAYWCSRHCIEGWKPWLCFALSCLAVVVLHSAGNVLSDWADYRRGVDNENAFAVPQLVFHKFEPDEYLHFAIGLFAFGIVLGVVIAAIAGWGLLIVGGVGVLLTALYSNLKFHALGDLDIFLIFSVLIILGTTYACLGEFRFDALVLALPIGIITVSVLHANNTFDIQSDSAAGIKTFAMLLGGATSCKLYMVYMVLPLLSIIALVITGFLPPLSLLCLVAAVPALKNIKAASHYDEKGIGTMAGLDQASAKLQIVFSSTLALGLFLSAILFK